MGMAGNVAGMERIKTHQKFWWKNLEEKLLGKFINKCEVSRKYISGEEQAMD